MSIDWLINLDHRLFFALNGMAAWKPLAALAIVLSEFGRFGVLLPAGLILGLEGWPSFRRHALALMLIGAAALAANSGLKQAISRPRPLARFEQAIGRHEVAVQAAERLKKRSFPSGHTTMAFFALGYLAWNRRRHAAWTLALAAAVGWSRIAMGSHFPLDCAAGALLGLFWSWLAWRVALTLEHVPWLNPVLIAPSASSSGSSSDS